MGRDTKKKVYAAIIGVVFFLSTIGLIFSAVPYGGQTDSFTTRYNDFVIKGTQTGYTSKIEGTTYNFRYLPSDVDFLDIDENAITILKSARAFSVTSNSTSNYSQAHSLAAYDLISSMQKKNVVVKQGFVDSGNPYGFEQIDCSDATQYVPVIHFVDRNETSIILDGNCIIAASDSNFGFLRISDRIIYGILGVIQ